MTQGAHRAGCVALLGRPNVGKSSLVNALVGEKVMAVSPKAQTTRHAIRGIVNGEGYQIVLVDTPGVHEPRHDLGKFMISQIRAALDEVCGICFVVDATCDRVSIMDERVLEWICEAGRPAALCVNKVDLLKRKDQFWDVVALFQDRYGFDAVVPVSAVQGTNLDVLKDTMVAWLPESPPLFPEEFLIDRTERFLTEEIIREKVFLAVEEEVPHCVAVVVESFKSPDEYPDRKTLHIRASIVVEKEGQKGILIGSGGKMIRSIRLAAEEELERVFGYPVDLELWVKVRPRWRKNPSMLRNLGYGQ
ncbi:MAG: GTPase Era [Thermanaerothrix sp.]|nr:GTPase Era [Thermanaerothrix sp.]